MRLRLEGHLRLGLKGQPGQHKKTSSLLKKEFKIKNKK